MDGGLDGLVGLIESKRRLVVVGERPIDLRRLEANMIYVLELPDGFQTAMGGRGGGPGNRHLLTAYLYVCRNGSCAKANQFEGTDELERLDLPYHATALPILLPDGRERIVSGVIDPELVASYSKILAQSV